MSLASSRIRLVCGRTKTAGRAHKSLNIHNTSYSHSVKQTIRTERYLLDVGCTTTGSCYSVKPLEQAEMALKYQR